MRDCQPRHSDSLAFTEVCTKSPGRQASYMTSKREVIHLNKVLKESLKVLRCHFLRVKSLKSIQVVSLGPGTIRLFLTQGPFLSRTFGADIRKVVARVVVVGRTRFFLADRIFFEAHYSPTSANSVANGSDYLKRGEDPARIPSLGLDYEE